MHVQQRVNYYYFEHFPLMHLNVLSFVQHSHEILDRLLYVVGRPQQINGGNPMKEKWKNILISLIPLKSI